MLAEELLELVNTTIRQKAESQTVEVKAAHVDCPKRLYDTLSSFSNQDAGGVLLFGIDEKSGYQVVGVYDPQDLQKRVNDFLKKIKTEDLIDIKFCVHAFLGAASEQIYCYCAMIIYRSLS